MINNSRAAIVESSDINQVIAPPIQRSIWFIRHGESEANAGQATCDPVCTDLTRTGYQQARRIADICREAPSRVIVSRYQRTRQTALPILKKFAIEPEVWDVHEFTYLAQLNGQVTTQEQRSLHVDAYWNEPNPQYVNGDGFESFADFFLRTQRVVNRLLHMRERFIIVFSHEQFITAAHWLLDSRYTYQRADITVDMMTSFKRALTIKPFPNAAILPVSIQNSKPRCEEIVTSHLG